LFQKIQATHQHPSELLEKYINSYWIAYNPTQETIDVPIVPDGCIDIICKNSKLFLSGLMEFTQIVAIEPKDHYFGIQFKPYAVAMLLDEDISVFNDELILLEGVNSDLTKELQKIFEMDAKPYGLMNDYFKNFFADKEVEFFVLEAIELIKTSHGNITVMALCEKLGIHQKRLERLFVALVGVSPKKFAKIVRFHSTHRVLSEEGMDNLSQKVLEKGYFDQAHFNRDFKKFTGVTPSSKLMSILYNT